HRSALVNMDRLRGIDGTRLVMANGARVTCSRSGKKTLKQRLGRIETGT
ncbi:MAG: LytTR family transcriptional regulator DNA-binding domain-containing protein, partial [Woeseiaceae bacterium]